MCVAYYVIYFYVYVFIFVDAYESMCNKPGVILNQENFRGDLPEHNLRRAMFQGDSIVDMVSGRFLRVTRQKFSQVCPRREQ